MVMAYAQDTRRRASRPTGASALALPEQYQPMQALDL